MNSINYDTILGSYRPRKILIDFLPITKRRLLCKKYYNLSLGQKNRLNKNIKKLKKYLQFTRYQYNSKNIRYFTYLIVKYFDNLMFTECICKFCKSLHGKKEYCKFCYPKLPIPPNKLLKSYKKKPPFLLKESFDENGNYIYKQTPISKKCKLSDTPLNLRHQCCGKTKHGSRCNNKTFSLFCKLHENIDNIKCYWII
jgi:hypothetical protein